ncbi:hypothetical protein EXIGLDRAFT_328166 [Exidia glandulosa HHB12029]|uniref:Uncharacterized protein n=1 Tax=Exidia glandulosa HHB12029 TaxID=1314781 RepID=A0A165LPG1_EXIGL|nr:hypothetical protein EXIGLDRAFT_328166 [Exidia glandulosa HHB12029]
MVGNGGRGREENRARTLYSWRASTYSTGNEKRRRNAAGSRLGSYTQNRLQPAPASAIIRPLASTPLSTTSAVRHTSSTAVSPRRSGCAPQTTTTTTGHAENFFCSSVAIQLGTSCHHHN